MSRFRWSLALIVLSPAVQGQAAPPPVTALAYSSDGKVLAAGAYRPVVVLHPPSRDVLAKRPDLPGPVPAVASAPGGGRLGVAAGSPGKPLELRLYTPTEPTVVGQPAVLTGHKDSVYGLAFSPAGARLATASYDRLVKLWDTDTGK